MDIRLYQNPLDPQQGQDDQAKKAPSPQDVTAVVAGRLVSLFRVEVPKVADDKLQALLPAILSDYVAGSVEGLHFALLSKSASGTDGAQNDKNTHQRLVMVCDQAVMTEAMKTCQDQGKRMVAVWPDYMRLPVPKDGVNLYQEGDQTLCRFKDGRGMTVANTLLDTVCGDLPRHQLDDLASLPDGAGLAVGHFSPQMPVIGLVRAFKWPVLLMAGAMILWAVYWGMAASQYQRNAAAYDAASVALFKKAFPSVRRIVNIEAQIKNQLRGQQAGDDNQFISLSAGLYQAVKKTPSVQLSALSYDAADQGLVVTVAASGYSALETLKSNVQDQGLTVEDQGSRQQDGRVIGIFTVTRAGVGHSKVLRRQQERHTDG